MIAHTCHFEVIAQYRGEEKRSQSDIFCGFLTGKELDPDFVAFNSLNQRHYFPWRFFIAFRGAFGQPDPLRNVLEYVYIDRTISRNASLKYFRHLFRIHLDQFGFSDPAGVQADFLNLYAYPLSNPGIVTDPSGLQGQGDPTDKGKDDTFCPLCRICLYEDSPWYVGWVGATHAQVFMTDCKGKQTMIDFHPGDKKKPKEKGKIVWLDHVYPAKGAVPAGASCVFYDCEACNCFRTVSQILSLEFEYSALTPDGSTSHNSNTIVQHIFNKCNIGLLKVTGYPYGGIRSILEAPF
jgi:hypothetical protein